MWAPIRYRFTRPYYMKLCYASRGIPKVLPIKPEIKNFLKGTGHPDFVFSKNGRPYSRRILERDWKRIVKQANKVEGTPIYPLHQGTKHSLGNQILNEEGMSLSEVQAMFGHADIRSTMVYAKTETNRLAEIMGGRSYRVHTKKTKRNRRIMAGVGGFETLSPFKKLPCLQIFFCLTQIRSF